MGLRAAFRGIFGILFNHESRYERIKFAFLTLTFFFVIASYTLAKELGNSVFISIVGKDYQPAVKMLTLFVFIPAIFLYSKLVDTIRRYQLLVLYSLVFGVVGLILSYYLGHSVIGLPNTNQSPYRLFGWIFYLYVEGFSPFIVSVFWAFANSISSPEGAKKNYGVMVSGSKMGGMLSSGLAWMLFSWSASNADAISDVLVHQLVFGFASCMLLCVPVVTLMLVRTVPGYYLHGYEAVYQVEKQKKEKHTERTGIFAGLILLLRYPYVLGIFGMVYFYEVIATVVSYLRLTIAQSQSESLSGVTSYLFKTMFATHALGVLISIVGTGMLLQILGERICLLLIPLLSGLVLMFFMVYTSPDTLMLAFVILKAINYAFSWPVRESLYIPTVKEIKFKSKSWVDAFGSKFAKASGSVFNSVTGWFGPTMLLPVHSFFFAGIMSLWFAVAYLLGRRFDQVVKNNEVIGLEPEASEGNRV